MNAGPPVTFRPATTRIDLETNAGDLFDPQFPILDDTGAPVEILEQDADGWAVKAQVRRNVFSATALHTWSTSGAVPNARIVPGAAAKILLVATPTETAVWQADWPDFTCAWDLDLIEPVTGPDDFDGVATPTRIAEGAFLLRPQVTR